MESLHSAARNDEKCSPCSVSNPQISISVYKKNHIHLSKYYTSVLLMGFRAGKGTTENAFNFTFSDVEAIGGYVLYTPMKA